MRVIAASAFFALLSVSSACATGLPGRFDGPANKHPLVLAADAEQKDRAGWKKLCFAVPNEGPEKKGRPSQQTAGKASIEACLTFAALRDPPTQILIGTFGVLQMRPAGRSFAVLLLPVSSAYSRELGHIRFDGVEAAKLEHPAPGSCDNEFGCFAWVEIPQAVLNRMKAAKAISFVGTDSTERDFSVPMPCCDFASVLDGAPLPVDEQDREQSRVWEVVCQRLADSTQ